MGRMSLDAKLYRGAAGSSAATEVSNCRDLSMPYEVSEGEMSSRGSTWELTGVGLIKGSIEFEMNWDETDASLAAFKSAFFGRTALAARTKDRTSGEGFDGDVYVTKFSKQEPLNGPQTVQITLKPCYLTRYPTWA